MRTVDEVRRIQEVYARRDASGKRALYSLFNAAAMYSSHRLECHLINALKRNRINELGSRVFLDVGCGNGAILRTMMSWGADPENCHGVDLLPDRIAEAGRLSPNMNFSCCNAEGLAYDDGEFDVLISFTVFSSILDGSMRKNLASEMLRVLGPGGVIVWYDYCVDNPKNPDVRGVRKKELAELFTGCSIDVKKVTLAPPIARALAPVSVIACDILEKIPFLRTHCLAIIRKDPC